MRRSSRWSTRSSWARRLDSEVADTPRPGVFRFAALSRPGLRHGITGRAIALPAEGDFSFVTGPDDATVLANRRTWCAEIGVSADRLICARQVHGTRVVVVDETAVGRGASSIEQAVAGADGYGRLTMSTHSWLTSP